MIDRDGRPECFCQVGHFNCIRHQGCTSDVVANTKDEQPLIASDSPVLIFFHRYKVHGLDGMFTGSCRDNPFTLEDYKHHGVRFGMRGYYLSGLKAYQDNVGAAVLMKFFSQGYPVSIDEILKVHSFPLTVLFPI